MVALQTGLAGGLVLILAVYLIGEQALLLLFGAKYAALIPLLSWLAILQSLRLSKAGCAVVAISQGRTGNAMMGNLFRVLSMPLSWYVAASGGSLLEIIWIGTVAEIVGYAVTLGLVRSRVNLPLRRMVLPIAATAATWVAVIAATGTFGTDFEASNWTTFGVIVLFLLSIASMGDLRHYIFRRVSAASED
jgi:O-antigen/teichoic acid export membrane protein